MRSARRTGAARRTLGLNTGGNRIAVEYWEPRLADSRLTDSPAPPGGYVYHPAFHARILLALMPLAMVSLLARAAAAQTSAGSPAASDRSNSDLDRFMEKVLARREVNRATFNQYVLDETESFEILGPGRQPLHRRKRDFTWYARNDMHVRSPVRFDGVTVGETDRRAYEEDWIKREQGRRERRARNEKEKGDVSIGPDGVQVSGPSAVEPRFVSEAYFMDFKFEPGNYYLAGREKLEGKEVLRVEYYPTRLFNDSDDEKRPREMRKDRRGREEQDIDRRMNKTALVTLWVDPAEHQIVKYTFDNVWLDFLPGAWLVRIDDLRASMTMGQPIAGVWLPRTMNIHAGLTLATGSFEASYERLFANYREAEVKTKITVPKGEAAHGVKVPSCPGARSARVPHGATRCQGAAGARGVARAVKADACRVRRAGGRRTIPDGRAPGRNRPRNPCAWKRVPQRRGGAEAGGCLGR